MFERWKKFCVEHDETIFIFVETVIGFSVGAYVGYKLASKDAVAGVDHYTRNDGQAVIDVFMQNGAMKRFYQKPLI